MTKILLIGPRQNKYNPNDTGGVSILFELLISELSQQGVNFTIIDTLKANHQSSVKMLINTVINLKNNIKGHDHISLHATINSFLILAPIILFFTKVFSKTSSLRKFAGNFNDIYNNGNFMKKFFIRFILKHIDYVFFETSYLVETFKVYNQNTFWFPNVRNRQIKITQTRTFNKRFVYVGSINEEKGIDELCTSIKQLPKGYTCDLYGPIKSPKYSSDFFNKIDVNYCGALDASSVIRTMNQYDVLILPSYREGYPGIIIEAFSIGMPVIATKLQGIMEMCKENKNAILIETKNSEQLLHAIKSINSETYHQLHKEALKAFSNFDNHQQTEKFLNHINY